MIGGLIDKVDNVELIRDQIGAILASETVSQQAYATAASKDPALWELRVFTERTNPWEQYLNDTGAVAPIVNVWWEDSDFQQSASNIMERQKSNAVFNIDCFGYGVSSDNAEGGHNPGDREAALEAHRAVRLVRNILMASEYTYLGMRGLVWRRWPLSIAISQQGKDEHTVQQVVGARLRFGVEFNEHAPQYVGEDLNFISIDVFRKEDGQLYFEADYDYS